MGSRSLTGRSVSAIDVAGHRVRLDGGEEHPYGALLLATGAEPVRLPIPGADLPQVHCLRSLADCRAIIAAATTGGRGGGRGRVHRPRSSRGVAHPRPGSGGGGT